MKYLLITIILGISLTSCINTNPIGQTIAVLEDITDTTFISRPEPNLIIKKFDLDKDKWQSARFRYGSITSVGYNKQFEITLEKEQSLLGNDLERRKIVAEFITELKEILTKNKTEKVLQHSSIWMPLVKELTLLQNDTIRNVTLYVFTDLQENSSMFSVYKTKDLLLLHRNIQKVKTLFLNSIGDFKKTNPNLSVIIVFQPRDLKEDVQFQKMVALYKLLFKELEIPITFKANI